MVGGGETANHFWQSARRPVYPYFIWIIVVGLILALQPFYRPFGLSSYDWQRWVETVMLATLSVPCLLYFVRIIGLLSRQIVIGLLCLMVATTISVISSCLGWVSLVSMLRFWLWVLVLVSLPFMYVSLTQNAHSVIAVVVVSGLGVYMCYLCVGIFVLMNSGVYDRTMVVTGFVNVNHAAGFLALSVLVLPALSSNIPNKFNRLGESGVAIVAVLAVTLLLIIGSRGSLLGMVIGTLAVLTFAKRDVAINYCNKMLYYFISGVSVYFVLKWLNHGEANTSEKSFFSDSGRFELYELAWVGVSGAPFWGNGPLSFASLESTPFTHSHNLILTFLYEYGLVAAFFVLSVIIVSVVWVCKIRDRWCSKPGAVAGMAVVVAFVVHSQFSGVAMIPLSLCLLALGISFWGASIIDGMRVVPDYSVWSFSLSLVIGGVYLGLVFLYWMGLSEPMLPNPRFWLKGELPLGS